MNLDLSQFPTYLQIVWLNNTIADYLLALIFLVGLLIGFKIFKKIVIHNLVEWAQKSQTDFDDFLVKMIKSINSFFYLYLTFYLSSRLLDWQNLNQWLEVGLIIWLVIEISSKIIIAIEYVVQKYSKDKKNKAPINAIKKISVGMVWLVGILLILSNLGINITALTTGLGIGGIAVALAMQNILGDLFSSFSIYFDKPFEVGDYIVLGDESGTVEKIGIKTTRIKALQGEEIVIANNDLTNARIHNYKRMKLRRSTFNIGVTYDTPQEKLAQIPQLINEIIQSVKLTKVDRVHFASFGNSSLNFSVVYFIESSEYNVFMDIQQEINLKIIEKFAKEKIEFAFPSQTIYLAK
ncbi:mechanosensitive ion channel family protein [Patescibacteria group bacterium]|nr:mechanosensitive ion channel family protein [Patescibacteria group bacterium]